MLQNTPGLVLTLFVAWFLSVPAVYAGSQQHKDKPNFSHDKLAVFSKQLEKVAAREGARVFYLARVGIPDQQLPAGVQFTHVGLAIYSDITLATGKKAKGYAIHNLYQKSDNPRKSTLIVDYPVDFFAGVHRLKAGILIPKAGLQKRLLSLIAQQKHSNFHNPSYSVISNPFSDDYQNCTEYLLDITFAAIYNTSDLKVVKANQQAYFIPKVLQTNYFERILATFTGRAIMSDHGERIATTTFGALAEFLRDHQLMQSLIILEDEKTVFYSQS